MCIRDRYFNSVIVKSNENLIGQTKKVKINQCNQNTLFGEIILETDSNLKVNSFSFENKKQNLLIENNSNQFNSRQKTLIKNLKSGEGYGIKINSLESSNGKILNSNFFFFIKFVSASFS